MKAPEDPKNRQFLQLNRYRRERTAVHVYLLSGTRFTGRIRSFDVHTLLLETQHGEMVIYGHAVSTIEPATAQRGRRPGAGAGAGAPRREGSGGGGYRRDGESAPRRDAGDRGWTPPRDTSPPPTSGPEVDGDVVLPSEPRSPVSVPTVTIVRRRSRLLPRE